MRKKGYDLWTSWSCLWSRKHILLSELLLLMTKPKYSPIFRALLCYILDFSLKVTERYKNYENIAFPCDFLFFFFILILVSDYVGSQHGKVEKLKKKWINHKEWIQRDCGHGFRAIVILISHSLFIYKEKPRVFVVKIIQRQ